MSFTYSAGPSSRKAFGSFQVIRATGRAISRFLIGSETDEQRRSRIKEILKDAKKGDMLQFERPNFLHYGIYIGKYKIVDFVSDGGGDVMIRDVFETIGDCEFAIDNYLDKDHKPLPEDEIVQRAIGCVTQDLKYDVGKYNCEHFATWCRYDYAFCHQPCEVAAISEKGCLTS